MTIIEIDFLKKAIAASAKNDVSVHSFLVNSWSNEGEPVTYEIIAEEINPKGKLEIALFNCERELQDLLKMPKHVFDKVMEENKISHYASLAKALHMEEPELSSPVIEFAKGR